MGLNLITDLKEYYRFSGVHHLIKSLGLSKNLAVPKMNGFLSSQDCQKLNFSQPEVKKRRGNPKDSSFVSSISY